MATDKLINHSQGESIISQLDDIATSLENVTTLSPAKFGMGYAVCDTAAGTAAKTATIANYRATEGALVTVKFTNGNTAANATLNLNSLGAVPILYKGSAIATDIIGVGDTCTFVYSTANSGSYTIINTDTLSGAGAGTVTSVGATGGIITDQTGGAAINSTGSVKLNLKSNTAYTGTVSDPATTDKIYPVALDGDGHPCVGVPWTDTTYTQAANSAISVDNTNHTIDVAVGAVGTKGVVELSTSIPATGAVDTKVATEKAVADSISNKAIGANSSTTAAIATFAGTDGKTLADSAVTIAKNATGVTDDDTKVPTSKAVKTYVDATATGISRYIGTITAASQLSTTAKKGDFYIVSTAWSGVHAGDEIIAEKDNPAKTIDGTNWTLLHNEADTNTTYTFAEGTTNGKFTVTPSDTGTAQSVAVHGLAASAYKGVDTTPTASSSNLVESGGVASALGNKQDTLTFDGTYNASTNKAATVSTVTNAINALDVTGTNSFGAGKTISAWSETDGKVSITSQNISITGSQISDIDTTMPSTAVDTKVPSTKLVKTQLSGKQDTLTFDGTYNASTNKAATVSTVTNAINALDVSEVTVGATKTINKISQADGKISVSTTDIQSASTSQKGLVQLNDAIDNTSTAQAATANAVKKVNDKVTTCETNILLVEQMNGAKNIVDLDASTVKMVNASGLTFTIQKGTITINGTSNGVAYIGIPFSIKAGQWFVSGCPSGGGSTTYLDDIRTSTGGDLYVSINDTGSGFMFTVPTDTTLFYDIRIASNYTANNLVFKPMIISKAAYDAGFTDYQPFARPNYDLTRIVSELQKKAVKVYTYHVNPNESDPEDAVTYLDDATGLTPAKMGASSFSYGSWANAWFLPRPCVLKFDGTVDYYLNPNDYSKKTDGTASTIDSSNSTGNVMLEFPKIWVKRVNDSNGARTVSIAPVNVDGTYKCWSNINAEDKEVDHFYLPAYNGTIHSSKMRSLSGVTLDTTYAPNYNRSQEVTAAIANNPSGKNMWYTETWADMCLIFDLLYLMGKSLDVQRTFGQGLSSGAETAMRAYVTGTHNAKGLFYGDVSGTSTAVKVLGMENLWGCRWHGVAGLINDNGTLKVKMTYGVADGSTAVGYNTTGAGYLNYGSTYGTAGYAKKMQADNTMGYKIIEMDGSDATYYCDYYYANNSQSDYARFGGGTDVGSYCGFFVYLGNVATVADWTIGAALSCRPEV